MSTEHFYGAERKGGTKRPGKPVRAADAPGSSATGRIARIRVGLCDGFIRLRDDREVYFHRGDLREGTAFNDLQVGHVVAFELLEDSVSGARALRVTRQKK
jgi:hypothetical protein